ncbi:MAG: hypothetical protein ACOYD1_07950 [Candidatus Nanopelagicales bacterium]
MTRTETAVVVALMAVRAAMAWVGPQGLSPDSDRYRYRYADVWAFWAGQGPGQLLQLINLLPVRGALVVQTVLAGVLWAWAAVTAAQTAGKQWPFWAVLLWAASPWWVVWDWRVLTEAVTVAAMALFAAGAAQVLRGGGSGSWWPLVVGGVVALAVRPLVVPLVAGVVLVVLVTVRRRDRAVRYGPVAVLAGVMAWSALQAVVWTAGTATYDYLPRPMTLTAIQASDRLGARSENPGYLELARDWGMPCTDFPIPYGFEGAWAVRVADCPRLATWLDRGGLPWGAEVTRLPMSTAHELVSGRWLDTQWEAYDSGFWLGRLHGLPVDEVMWLGVLLAAAVVVTMPGRHTGARLIVLATAGYAFVMFMADGLENWRHMAPALVMVLPFAVAYLGRGQGYRAARVAGAAGTEASA